MVRIPLAFCVAPYSISGVYWRRVARHDSPGPRRRRRAHRPAGAKRSSAPSPPSSPRWCCDRMPARSLAPAPACPVPGAPLSTRPPCTGRPPGSCRISRHRRTARRSPVVRTAADRSGRSDEDRRDRTPRTAGISAPRPCAPPRCAPSVRPGRGAGNRRRSRAHQAAPADRLRTAPAPDRDGFHRDI